MVCPILGAARLEYLSWVTNGHDGPTQIARILAPGGLFVSAAPAGGDRRDVAVDHVESLSKEFAVSPMPGLDPVTDTATHIYFAYRR